jgi:pimeloyl-ACP methyl ester carboxylesterase
MTNVVFIHGLWVASTAWEPWQEYFQARGHEAFAPAWPGEHGTPEASRLHAEDQAGYGIDELTEHFAAYLAQFDTPPVVIGHSFGGLIAQKLLGENKAAAAVAIDPAPIKGVKPLPLAQLRSAFPVLGNPLNKGRAKGLTEAQWRFGFGNALTADESNELWAKWAIPSPGAPLFQAAVANFSKNSPAGVDIANATRGPLLITGGTADHTVPLVSAKAAYELYGKSSAVTDFHEFEGRGHSLTIDSGWREVADVTLEWMAQRQVASAV